MCLGLSVVLVTVVAMCFRLTIMTMTHWCGTEDSKPGQSKLCEATCQLVVLSCFMVKSNKMIGAVKLISRLRVIR